MREVYKERESKSSIYAFLEDPLLEKVTTRQRHTIKDKKQYRPYSTQSFKPEGRASHVTVFQEPKTGFLVIHRVKN